MEQFVLSNEVELRLGVAAAIFALMALWEFAAPRRHRVYPRLQRWGRNIGLMICGAVLLRIAFPIAAVAFAALVQEWNTGLLNVVDVAPIPAVIIAIILLDLGIYVQHVLSHRIPILWRLHRVHHADPDFDVTTALRFHPIEFALSMAYKFVLILIIGPPLAAVVLFEILLNGTAMFNHGNVILPRAVDRYLRWFLVTPDMHRVHHSIRPRETNCNYGFSLPFWDRVFGTYRDQPQDGHANMTIGMPLAGGYFTCVALLRMLGLPFFRLTAEQEPPGRGENTTN